MSINAVTIDQLNLACCHTKEMMAAGVTENLAIRTLELFADVYAKLLMGGNASPTGLGVFSDQPVSRRTTFLIAA